MIVVFPLYSLIFICHVADWLSSLCLFFFLFSNLIYFQFLQEDLLLWLLVFFALVPVSFQEISFPVWSYCLFLPFLASLVFQRILCINSLHLSNSVFINLGWGFAILTYSPLEVHELLSWLSCVLPDFFQTISGKLKCSCTMLCACMTVAERHSPDVFVVVQLHNIIHKVSHFISN